jgi:hypothetical protein
VTKPLSFTQASLKRAILAAHQCGLRVTGIRPDGTLLLDGAARTLATAGVVTHNRNTPADADEWGDIEA